MSGVLYWGKETLGGSKTLTLLGAWQDGLAPSYLAYTLQPVAIGTHVGNNPHVIKGTYSGGTFTIGDITYNLTYCADTTATYVATYGATYAATYYRDIACNVRALEWI